MKEVNVTPEIYESLRNDILSSVHCSMPGKVVSFDSISQTAVIQPMLCKLGNDGIVYLFPEMKDVPVFLPCNSGFLISAGDECLLIFSDFCIDNWYESGEASVPVSARQHDYSDAFAFVGFKSRARISEV